MKELNTSVFFRKMIQYVWVGNIRNKAEHLSNKEGLLLVPDRLVKTSTILM